MPEIWHFFQNPKVSNDHILRDVCDGSYVKKHALNANPQNFLKIALYYDDIEIHNPLQSSQKYKLAMFYFQIFNIPVEFHSKLSSFFLLGICKSKHVQKYGLKAMLSEFTNTIQKMTTIGVTMTINRSEENIKGTLIYVLCNTPAAGIMGGFKEESLALKPCRCCNASKTSMRENFVASNFEMRDMASHLNQCEVLANPTLTKRKQYWSKVYDVNNLSPLCEIPSFPITANLLMDAMHTICEGLACHLLGLFLHRCIIEQDLFSLDWLYNQIQQYPYPQNEMKNVLELTTRHKLLVMYV